MWQSGWLFRVANRKAKRLVTGFQPQTVQNAIALVEFGGSVVTEGMEQIRGRLFFQLEQIDDPVLQTQQPLAKPAKRMDGHFELIRAVSFANRRE